MKGKILIPALAAFVLSGCKITIGNTVISFGENKQKNTENTVEKQTNSGENNYNNNNNNNNQGGGNNNQPTSGTFVFPTSTDGENPTSYTTSFGVKLTFSQGSGGSAPFCTKNGEMRLYANNTMTAEATGKTMSKMTFTKGDYSSKPEADVTANPGKYSAYTWTGSSNKVTFTVGATGQWRFTDIKFDFGEGGNQGGNQGGQTEHSTTFETLKGMITEIGVDLFDCSASELVFANIEDERDDADVNYYDTDDLTFVSLQGNSNGTGAEILELLEGYLPQGSSKMEAYCDEDAEEGYYDYWFDGGEYIYSIFVMEYGEDAVYFMIDIFPSAQIDAYYDFMYGSSSGGEEGYDIVEVCTELTYSLFGVETNYFEYDSDYDCYYSAFDWGTESEYTLLSAVEEAVEYLPLYFIEVTAPYEDTWEDGDAGAFAQYETDDGSIVCEIGSYAYGGSVSMQFVLYEA